MPTLYQQFRERLPHLPEEVRNAMYSEETLDALELITNKQELTADQATIVSRSTMKLLAGLIKPNELVGLICTETGLAREKVGLVVQEINTDIFNPIKEALKKVHGLDEAPQAAEPKTAPTSIPSTPKPSAPILSPLSVPAPLEPKVPQETKQVPLPPIQVKVVVQPVIKKEVAPQAPSTPVLTGDRGDSLALKGVSSVTPTQEKPKLHVPHKPRNGSGAIMPNILEQKLGGAFRIQKDSTAYAAPHNAPETISPPTNTPSDPYRELP